MAASLKARRGFCHWIRTPEPGGKIFLTIWATEPDRLVGSNHKSNIEVARCAFYCYHQAYIRTQPINYPTDNWLEVAGAKIRHIIETEYMQR